MSYSWANLTVLLHALTPIVPGDSGTITSTIFSYLSEIFTHLTICWVQLTCIFYQFLTLVIQFHSLPQENDGVFTLLAIFCVLS